jgi:hypothetical protein
MKLAFFQSNYGSEIDKMISVFTHGPYSHVELVFKDANPTKAQAFSARPSEGARFTTIDLTQPCWTVVPLVSTAEQQAKCYIAAQAMVSAHLHYDWFAIIGFLVPLDLDTHKGEMCSEAIEKVIQEGYGGEVPKREAWEVSPNELYKMVTRQ